jgi:hypothetical protein
VEEMRLGRSLALATGHVTQIQLGTYDTLGAAVEAMPLDERRFWAVYKSEPWSIRLPTVDWENSKLPIVSLQKKAAQRYKRRSDALRELYKCDTISPENAMWFTINHEVFLPLVKAIDRMQAASRIRKCSLHEVRKFLWSKEIECLHSILLSTSDIVVKRSSKGLEDMQSLQKSSGALVQWGEDMGMILQECILGKVKNRSFYWDELRCVEHIMASLGSCIERLSEQFKAHLAAITGALDAIEKRCDSLKAEGYDCILIKTEGPTLFNYISVEAKDIWT